MNISVENILLILAILFFFSILAGKVSSKLGVPALLLFLVVGMLCGIDGLGIDFDNIEAAQAIGTVALSIILFSGGMDTRFEDIKPVLAPGLILSTLGVLITALITGVAVWWLFGKTEIFSGIGLITCILLAATMSSTDSAAVFSILRSKSLNLKNNLRPMLELESGSNDPMAYVLMITLLGLIEMGNSPDYLSIVITVVAQMVIGAGLGIMLGQLSVRLFNKLQIGADMFPILVITTCIFIFSFTYFMKGNGYLAVYLGGLVVGNAKYPNKRLARNFFDGLAWLSQLLMFLVLGLLVNPHELLPVLLPGLIISVLMIFFSRPLTVFLSLAPIKGISTKSKLFVSWVGLKGAVPIIFAIYVLAADIPYSREIFNTVFLCTLVSLLVQGTTLPTLAKWLGLSEHSEERLKVENFDVDFAEEIKSTMSEIKITTEILSHGSYLKDLAMPDKTLAIMVKRDDKFFVPTGRTRLKEGDSLLIISDDQQLFLEEFKKKEKLAMK